VQRHDAYAICDEVYEHLTFDGWKHIPLMTLPGMRERCMRIGSAGKTFSLTGWKVGYVTCRPLAGAQHRQGAPEPHLHHARPTCSAPWRSAWARTTPISPASRPALQAKRDRLAEGLAELGFGVLPTQGSYFITTDFSPLGFTGDDVAFCRHLTEAAKVTAIPVSAFYDGADAPKHYARFAFCKNESVLREALARIGAWMERRAGARREAG
jgi:N-succinyldiaminopimelate aminotransferase